MKEISVGEFRKQHPLAFEKWLEGAIENTGDEFYILDDGRVAFTTDGGYQSDPMFVFNGDTFEEEYPE